MRVCKKILCAIFSLALSFLVVMAGIFPAVIPASAEQTSKSAYEQTNVLDDLKKATVNDQPFNLTAYNFDEKKPTQVLSLVEYCYSFYSERQGNYGLYIYLYNPKGLKFNGYSPLNKIQLALDTATDAHYTKYNLKYLNCSTETNYEGLFYKFRVDFTDAQQKNVLSTVNSSERVYRVSGVELLTSGATNATEYAVATTYKYSGYAAGYGSNENAGSTLTCATEEAEVLTLNVHPTQYRPSGTNGKNDYTQDSLHSVYFAVPNDIINRYGAMTAVHAMWKNAVLAPALVTGNEDAYDAILPYIGKSMNGHNEDLNYMYMGAWKMTTATGMGSLTTHSYGYSYNLKSSWPGNFPYQQFYGEDIDTLYAMYYTGGGTNSADSYTVSSEDILAKLKASKTQYGGVLVNGKYSAKMFSSYDQEFTDVNIQADETFSLTSQKISKNWWDKLWNLRGDVTTTVFDGIEAIHAVTDYDFAGTKEEVCKKLYISEADYDDFKSYYDSNKALCTTYLFRYQTSDYTAQEATLLKQGKVLWSETWTDVDSNAFFFQQTVNLDFDIIDVTFSNGEKNTVIPVVSNPIDIVPDATPPVYTKTDKEGIDWLKILTMVVGIILAVVFCFFFWPLIQPLVVLIGKGIVWLITLPFKLIGQAIKKRKRKKEDQEEDNGKNG